jgi:carboxyl-terminal processing protease
MATTFVGAVSAHADTELNCQGVREIQQQFLEHHLAFSMLTTELKQRAVKQYLKRLDDSKLYLLEEDYQTISKAMDKIFDDIERGDCSTLIETNKILTKRMYERMAFVKQYLGADYKIDRSVKMETDSKKRKRPKTLAEARALMTAQTQFDIANYVATGIGLDAAKKHVLKNWERVVKHLDKRKNQDVLGVWLDVFASALDPHSNYMAPEIHEDFEINMKLALDGIGASLGWKNGFTVIEQLLPGGAALSSGLVKVKDKIVAVAQGKDGEFVDVIEMELRDVIKLIRGKKGTTVRLKLLRRVKGVVEKHDVALVRDKIILEEQAAFIKYFDRDVRGKRVKVAFLNLPSFYDDQTKDGKSAHNDLRRLVKEAVENKADALVLDLSQNGGGSLQDAVDVAGLFFPSGNVLKVSARGPAFQALADEDGKTFWSGPLVVLTSRVSASASEIVSGALQDYRRAVIVGGDHTFGKGTVQSVQQLPPGLGAIKTTTAMFYTAGGYSTQHRGVPGDIVFPSTLAREEINEKSLDYSLPTKKTDSFLTYGAYTLIGPDRWQVVNKDMLDNLRAKAKPRIAKATDFKKAIAELKKPKPSTVVSIAELLKGKDPNSTKDEDDDKDELRPSREERIKEYLKRADVAESINIATDLVGEMGP